MPARDKYHDVVEALQKEGWTITHDPYKLMVIVRRVVTEIARMCPTDE